ncbi:MAG: hypothetical protein M1385_00230, partial [Candidatus Marsarchaeota archaeon]|nr:hypothetical protein [Candidatus Marsarchaeota archaeon]
NVMPIKHNLTKYDKLRDQIHRLSQKKEGEYGVGDELLRSTAVLIAAFASGQSWNTHRALDTRGSFRDPAITNEFRAAVLRRSSSPTPYSPSFFCDSLWIWSLSLSYFVKLCFIGITLTHYELSLKGPHTKIRIRVFMSFSFKSGFYLVKIIFILFVFRPLINMYTLFH